jgi:hypothetical protein
LHAAVETLGGIIDGPAVAALWAELVTAHLVGSADNPLMHNIGMRTLAAALESD